MCWHIESVDQATRRPNGHIIGPCYDSPFAAYDYLVSHGFHRTRDKEDVIYWHELHGVVRVTVPVECIKMEHKPAEVMFHLFFYSN
jgi:hypothetical protein